MFNTFEDASNIAVYVVAAVVFILLIIGGACGFAIACYVL